VLVYVFSRRLKSAEDFAERYGLFVFTDLRDESQVNASFTERCINRLFFRKELAIPMQDRVALAQQQLTLAAQDTFTDKEAVTIAVIGGTNAADRFADFKAAVAKSGVTLEMLGSPLSDAASLERLADAEGVVLAETVGTSCYNDIYHELALCKHLNRPVLGAFVLE
jgi:hypothetical protein